MTASAPPRVGVRNAANALTGVRLLLVPAFVALLFAADGHHDTWRVAAGGLFAVAVLTDRVDGEVARRRGLVTPFGQVADPIVDKALAGAALVGLSTLGDVAWWVTGVILAREVGVTGLRLWVIRHGVIPASRGGKAKTLLQSLAIGLYVLPLTGAAASVRWWVMAAALLVTLGTGVDYLGRALRLRRTARAVPAARAPR